TGRDRVLEAAQALTRLHGVLPELGHGRSARPREIPLLPLDDDGAVAKRSLADPTKLPDQRLVDAEQGRRLTALVAQLPTDAQLYLKLRFFEDPPKPPREIARLMGRSVQEIYRLHDQVYATLRTAVRQVPEKSEDVRLDNRGRVS